MKRGRVDYSVRFMRFCKESISFPNRGRRVRRRNSRRDRGINRIRGRGEIRIRSTRVCRKRKRHIRGKGVGNVIGRVNFGRRERG